jgi:threonine/homoserine/homoserine lactone efflux protein
MPNEFINFLSEFWLIFSFSFIVALTGAMSPGPLLTYTIIKSAKTNKRGYLMGLWIITGHAILEMGIVILLLLGFSFVLKNVTVVRIIGVSGGLILILFGASIIRDIFNGNISTNFLNTRDEPKKDSELIEDKGIENPIIGGIMVSMSNPYWWVWWATIGFAFMIQFNISFKNWTKLLAFFLGHEAGDLIWYLLVSTLAFFGLRHMNRKAYYGILMFCALFMVLFGIYLGISPFLKNTM